MSHAVLDIIANTLANCPTFWALVEAADANEAAAHIHQTLLDAPAENRYGKTELDDLRPYSLIYMDTDGYSYRREGPGTYTEHGKGALIEIHQALPEEQTAEKAAEALMSGRMVTLLHEFVHLADDPAGGYLATREASIIQTPGRLETAGEKSGLFDMLSVILVEWGPER